MRSLAVSLAIVIVGMLVSIRDAAAQDAHWATAHFECISGESAVKAKKKVKLGAELGCIVVIDSGAVDGAWGRMWIVQDGLSEVPHDRNGALTAEEDKQYMMFDGTFLRLQDYAPCKKFEIHAAIFTGDSDMTYTAWEGKMAVTPTCKKPKKIKAALSCDYEYANGTELATYSYPGTGAKVRPRIEGGVSCKVKGKKKMKAFNTGDFVFTLSTGKTVLSTPMWNEKDLRPYGMLPLELDTDFESCMSFTVRASITNDLGQVIWTGKQKIAQDCPD